MTRAGVALYWQSRTTVAHRPVDRWHLPSCHGTLRYGESNVMLLKHLVKYFAVLMTCAAVSTAQDGPAHPNWPGRGQLFVGACYQPVDRSPKQIDGDIAIMKHAGFNVARMGDLSWDSFEPSQGKFSFEWFDRIRSEEHTSELQSLRHLVCRLLLEKKKKIHKTPLSSLHADTVNHIEENYSLV